MSYDTLCRALPADGTLDPLGALVYATRDADHVVPWKTIGPDPGEVWRVDNAFITNIHTSKAYYTVTFAPNNVTRAQGTPPGNVLRVGSYPFVPVVHYAWGRELAHGESEGVDFGGEVIRGNNIGATLPGMAIWLGAWPGSNTNPPGAGNDGVAAGIMVTIHGERLA